MATMNYYTVSGDNRIQQGQNELGKNTWPESMTIQGKVNEWQDWTGLCFQSSGLYIIENALSPVYIDFEDDFGEYIEPNVWVIHSTRSMT